MKDSTRPMRIMLVIGSAHTGGAEGQLVRLAGELHRRDVQVRVLFLNVGGPLTKQLDADGVPWEVLCKTNFPSKRAGNLAALFRLGARLASWQPDVVSAWLAGAVWRTLPLAALLTRAKRVAAFRGDVRAYDLKLLAPVFRFAVTHAHAVTVNAAWLRGEAARWGARPDRVALICNGVDVPPSSSNVAVDPPSAVVIANFQEYKGHDFLVDALALVKEPLTVRLVGEGNRRSQTQTRAIARGLVDRLKFVESPADVRAELSRAQFAIHPSRREGLPNAVLEELASGLPVIATDVGGIPSLIEDGVEGFLVPAGDEKLLADRISKLASSRGLRLSMAAAARSRAQNFAWDTCAESYLRIFRELFETGRGRR
jgi:glycosyltransferase involved in cell wall biosynthesis